MSFLSRNPARSIYAPEPETMTTGQCHAVRSDLKWPAFGYHTTRPCPRIKVHRQPSPVHTSHCHCRVSYLCLSTCHLKESLLRLILHPRSGTLGSLVLLTEVIRATGACPVHNMYLYVYTFTQRTCWDGPFSVSDHGDLAMIVREQ